jgi:tetratricopeptide (TPR) repeat protein
MEWNNGNNQEQLNYEIKVSSLNPSAARDLNIGRCYYLLNDFERALAHYEKYLEDKGESTGELFENYYRLAYAYSQLGLEDRAKYFFNKQTEICIEAEKTGSYYFISGQGQYDLAGVYAATGQKTKSLDYLRMVNQIKTYPAWGYHLIKIDPILDSIRDDPEFQQILHDIEAKYQAQHEKIRQLLEENDML